MNNAAGFVLAGGKSSRMGQEKAFLQFGQKTLLEHALEVIGAVAADVHIVGQPDKFRSFAPVVPDVFPDRGPLGGIHAALNATCRELNIILAVDTPFITVELLRYLAERARRSAALITVPRVNGRFQPLCAVYRRDFRDMAQEALQAGRNKIDPLFAPEITEIVEESELTRLEFPAAMFDNLNTREELEAALRRAHD